MSRSASQATPASNPFELFGPDALGNLERKLRRSTRHPASSAYFVCDEEVKRVCGLHEREVWPPLASQRMAAIAAGIASRPRGSPGRRADDDVSLFASVCVQEALMASLKGKSKADLTAWCTDCGLSVEPLNRGNAVAEYLRTTRFPWMGREAVRNLVSQQRKRFFMKD